jgi:hypothetical protein
MFMYLLWTTTNYGGDSLRPELDRKTLLSRESCFRQLLSTMSAGRIFHTAFLRALVPGCRPVGFVCPSDYGPGSPGGEINAGIMSVEYLSGRRRRAASEDGGRKSYLSLQSPSPFVTGSYITAIISPKQTTLIYESSMQMAELQRLHLPQACTIADRDVLLDSRPCRRATDLTYYQSSLHNNTI